MNKFIGKNGIKWFFDSNIDFDFLISLGISLITKHRMSRKESKKIDYLISLWNHESNPGNT